MCLPHLRAAAMEEQWLESSTARVASWPPPGLSPRQGRPVGFLALSHSFIHIPGVFVSHLVSRLWFGAISVPCLRGSDSQEMLGRRLLTGLNSFLLSCLCHQPRGIRSAEIRFFPLGNPRDGSHGSPIRLGTGWGGGGGGSPPSDWEVLREANVTFLSEWGS